ncbi:HGGxSTG domain-containing protein [Methylocystis sp. B8]|uniref:HGGxSTG domain-containing protein n=1 Tax=Methylocystis sp. B8 TaxID=544938 RepID=UPI002484A4F4|nr:HGGxSTG domain-containing protein [Methylocystis sp. B8]
MPLSTPEILAALFDAAPKRKGRIGRPPSKNKRPRIRGGRRKRCDARIKQIVYVDKKGIQRTRAPRCRQWAMANGRCRMHGGLSTGWKTDEGAERAIAAMVEGRRKWVEQKKTEGGKFSCGRKSGGAWITSRMRERAAAEAKRLGYDLPPDAPRSLILKLSGLVTQREWQARRERRAQKFERFAAEDRATAIRRAKRNASPEVEIITFEDARRILAEQFDD